MKSIIRTTIILYCAVLFSCSNDGSFTITDVNITPEVNYQKIAGNALGKKLKLVFYDSSVKISLEGKKEPKILKLFNSGDYIGDGYTLKINKSYGRISNITLDVLEPINEPPYMITVSVKAKR